MDTGDLLADCHLRVALPLGKIIRVSIVTSAVTCIDLTSRCSSGECLKKWSGDCHDFPSCSDWPLNLYNIMLGNNILPTERYKSDMYGLEPQKEVNCGSLCRLQALALEIRKFLAEKSYK